MIANRGQLSFSTYEQTEVFGAAGTINGTASFPDIGADPGDSTKSCLRCILTGIAGSDWSRQTFVFPADVNEIWIEFKARYTHPAAAGAGTTLRFFRLLNSSDVEQARLQRNTDSDSRTVAGGITASWTTDLAKDTWGTIKIHYKKDSGAGDGVCDVSLNGVSVATIDTHTGVAIRKIQFECEPIGVVGTTAGTKAAYFKDWTWNTAADTVGMLDYGLQLRDYLPGASQISQQLFYYYDHRRYGNTSANLTVRFDYKLTSSGTWITGTPVSLSADVDGEYTKFGTIFGLSPRTSYDFRAVVTDSASFNLTTQTCSYTTSNSKNSHTSIDKIAVTSCNQQRVDANSPKTTQWNYIQTNATQGLFAIGDQSYGDEELGSGPDDPSSLRGAIRMNILHDWDANQALMHVPFFTIPDDHDYGADNSMVADPGNSAPIILLYAQAKRAMVAYFGYALGNLNSGVFNYALQVGYFKLVGVDMRTEKSALDSIVSATQLDSVKKALADTTGCTVFLVPGPCMTIWPQVSANDGYNWDMTEFESYLDYFDQNTSDGKQMLICYGDRHMGGCVATEWSGEFGDKILSAINVSPFTRAQLNWIDFSSLGVHLFWQDTNGHPAPISRILLLNLDQANNQVSIVVRDGIGASDLFTKTYTAFTPSPAIEVGSAIDSGGAWYAGKHFHIPGF